MMIIHVIGSVMIVWPRTKSGHVSRKRYWTSEPFGIVEANSDKTVSEGNYAVGLDGPHYPVPAMRTRVEYDYSMLRPGTVIGMQMLEDNNKGCLVEYWLALC